MGKRKRTVRALAGAGLALSLGWGGTTAIATGPQVTIDATSGAADSSKRPPERTLTLQLPHSISVKEAAKIASSSGGYVTELRITAGVVSGGYIIGTQTGDLQRRVSELNDLFKANYNREPVVTALEVAEEAKTANSPTGLPVPAQQVLRAAASAPVTRIDTNQSLRLPKTPRPQARLGTTDRTSATDGAQIFPLHFPSTWTGFALPALDGRRNNTMNWFTWESSSGANPAYLPNDWGIEIGFTLYNDNIGGTGSRPYCVSPDQDPDESFWAQTWNTPDALWASNLPSFAFAYADDVLTSDPCSTNGLELGVGHPRGLSQDTVYFMQSATLKGTQPERESGMSHRCR